MMNDTLFRILAVLIFVAGAAISISFRQAAERASAEKISLKEEGLLTTIVLRFSGLVVWVGVFAYMINPAWMNWSRFDLPLAIRWLGVVMGFLSVLLAYWTFRNLGKNVTPTVITRANHTLVTSGPYRWIRHPLYVMGLIAYLGFALLAENWFIAIMAVVVFVVIALRVRKEETRLVETFGAAYREYMQQTGKFLPKLNL
jgi:protein-S-isoprenylcysteine O-methyltransferase Ste14